MSVALYDLAARLRAAHDNRPVPRLIGVPHTPVRHPIFVRVTDDPASVTVVHDTTVTVCADAPAILSSLDAAGLTIANPSPPTVVIEHPATLRVLLNATRHPHLSTRHEDVATAIGWVAARSHVPATTALVNLPSLAASRWYTGALPAHELDVNHWRTWLAIPDPAPQALPALLDRITTGQHLPGLDPITDDDLSEWARYRSDRTSGYDWRTPDHVGRAAVGLATYSTTTDLYAAALLNDPLHRRRAVHSGDVIEAVVIESAPGLVNLDAPRLDCRHRPGADLAGWRGRADDPETSPFSARLSSATTHGTGLRLDLTTGVRTTPPPVGTPVALRAAAPLPSSLKAAKSNYARLYSTRTSWLTTGRTPTPTRRDVPLEVLVAAAESES